MCCVGDTSMAMHLATTDLTHSVLLFLAKWNVGQLSL